MGTHRACIIVLLLAGASSCARYGTPELTGLPPAGTGGPLDSSQAAAVLRSARWCPEGTEIAIGLVGGDSTRYAGILRRNDSLVYIDNSDSVFEVGSITKTFTGTMFAKLMRDGIVRPGDPVQKYLPVTLRESGKNGREMTLLDLAEHTSGLPFEPTNLKGIAGRPFDPYSPYSNYTTTLLYEYLSGSLILQYTPGERRTYSNLGGGLLGHILTLATGKTYEQLLGETICVPLGMRSTFVEPAPGKERLMVHGRDARGGVLPPGGGDCGALTGAGGIRSSVRDLIRYIRANMTDTTFFALAQRPTRTFDAHLCGSPGWAPYCEGEFRHMGAFGATGGFTCGLIFERRLRVGVVVLTNVSAFTAMEHKPAESLCRALYDPLPSAAAGRGER